MTGFRRLCRAVRKENNRFQPVLVTALPSTSQPQITLPRYETGKKKISDNLRSRCSMCTGTMDTRPG